MAEEAEATAVTAAVEEAEEIVVEVVAVVEAEDVTADAMVAVAEVVAAMADAIVTAEAGEIGGGSNFFDFQDNSKLKTPDPASRDPALLFLLGWLSFADYFDFHLHVARQTRYLNRGARGRLSRKIFGVDGVHGGEIIHIGKEYGGLHDVIERRAGGFDDSF
jgi:hypothetical protein